MPAYTLTGSGVQTLSANVTALHITINTLPIAAGMGRSNPTAHYDVGLIRFGDGTGYWTTIPILGGPQWVGVPFGTTVMGYALFGAAEVTFVEVIGGTSPFVGPTPSLSTLLDVTVSSPSNGQVLEWIAADGKWENVTLPGATASVTGYALVEDHQGSGTAGGSATTGSWQTRSLNTIVSDRQSLVALASNALTLAAGHYLLLGRAPFWNTNESMLRLFDVTNTLEVSPGDSVYAPGTPAQVHGEVRAIVTPAASNQYRLESRVSRSQATNGYGVPAGGGGSFTPSHETYASVQIWKLP